MTPADIRDRAIFMGRSFDRMDQMKRGGRALALPSAAKDGQVARAVVDYANAIGVTVEMKDERLIVLPRGYRLEVIQPVEVAT